MNIDLTGKTALVCGASEGIGAACAQSLANLGCKVILLARTESKLQNLVKTLEQSTQRSHGYIACDVSDRKKLASLVEAEVKKHSAIEILINNTGGPSPGPISQATEEQFEQAFQNHLLVNVLLTKIVLPGMKEKKYGRIITITSTSVKIPIPHLGVSNTTRWAVSAWAKTLSLEVAPFGITVNNILPGYTDTERLNSLLETMAKNTNRSAKDLAQEWQASIPAKRFARPQEVADVIAFLATPAASYINGVALSVDGGKTGCI